MYVTRSQHEKLCSSEVLRVNESLPPDLFFTLKCSRIPAKDFSENYVQVEQIENFEELYVRLLLVEFSTVPKGRTLS